MNKLRTKRLRQGLCLWCGDKTKNHKLCPSCQKIHRERARAAYHESKAVAARPYNCTKCGKPGHSRRSCGK